MMAKHQVLVGFLLGLSALGCADGPDADADAAVVETQNAISADLVARTWPARMANSATRAPFEADGAWASLFKREYDVAFAGFAPAGGIPLARMHVEYSAFYREAVRMGAEATLQVYLADVQSTDPAGVAYLVGVAQALLGQTEAAGATLATLDLAAIPADRAAAHAAWTSWIAAGAVWPPDASLASLPGTLPAVAPGQLPVLGEMPQIVLTERDADAREVPAADLTDLYRLARWHEAAARAAAPGSDALIAQLLAPWALPGEPSAPVDVQVVDDAWLFGGFLMAAEDAAFFAALGTDGVAAVDAWAARAPLAAAIKPAVVDGKVSVESMLDQSAWLGRQVEAAMVAAAGAEEPYQRPFADVARIAALRAGMFAADATGERRDAGVLRINALERSTGPVADPVFFVSVAAWDAANRNPIRAQDLVHGLLSQFPPLQAARYSLDAMHIRLGRNAPPSTPVH
jgi:hypothetical protein